MLKLSNNIIVTLELVMDAGDDMDRRAGSDFLVNLQDLKSGR